MFDQYKYTYINHSNSLALRTFAGVSAPRLNKTLNIQIMLPIGAIRQVWHEAYKVPYLPLSLDEPPPSSLCHRICFCGHTFHPHMLERCILLSVLTFLPSVIAYSASQPVPDPVSMVGSPPPLNCHLAPLLALTFVCFDGYKSTYFSTFYLVSYTLWWVLSLLEHTLRDVGAFSDVRQGSLLNIWSIFGLCALIDHVYLSNTVFRFNTF